MVQQNLVSYIVSQRKQGRKLEDINKFLIQAGYEKEEVESSIQYVINLQTNPEVAEQQRIQQLTSYIQTQLQAGYESRTIANFLTSRGYPYYEVNSALQQATAPKKEVGVEHKLVVFALVAMFIMTAAVTVMYFKAYTLIGIGVPDQLLDVEAEKLTTIVQQGGDLSFQVKLINFGYEKRFDVELEYSIVDRDTQGVVLQKSETLALSTTLENIVKFDIPKDIKPGKYVLRVDATYKDYTATAGFIFDILSKDIAQERLDEIRDMLPEPESEEDIPELAPEVPGEIPSEVPEAVPTPITPPPAQKETKFYSGKTRQQALEMVKAVSVREPQRAIDMCNEFQLSMNVERCILTIAQFKKTPAVCDELPSGSGRDSCYLQVILDLKAYELCGNIGNSGMRGSCEALAAVEDAERLSRQGQTPDFQMILDSFPTNLSTKNQ